jgi:alkylhydroperoxidase family enzyme
MVRVPDAVVDALRAGRPIADAKLQALRKFSEDVVHQRGHVRGAGLEAFLAAGYGRQQVLEVLLVVAMKTLSNYANHLLDTPVDTAFQGESWQPASAT